MDDSKYLDKLNEKCKLYAKDECYVYKLCYNILNDESKDKRWMVIMQKLKLSGTKTNEKRKNVVNKAHAKFRSNKLYIVDIFDIFDSNITKTQIVHECDTGFKLIRILYEIGKIIECDQYDENIDKICTRGIHYFKTPITAYYYRDVPKKYTGHWITWYDSGQKASEGGYIDGYQSGRWIFWTCNNDCEVFYYVNGNPEKQHKWSK